MLVLSDILKTFKVANSLNWLEMVIVMMKPTISIVLLMVVTAVIYVEAQHFALIVYVLLEIMGKK